MNLLYDHFSLGFLLLALLAWLAWRAIAARNFGAAAVALLALLLWGPFEWARPYVGHGYVTGTEVRRVPRSDAQRTTDDVDYIYTKGWGGDSQFRNEDSWLFLKRNSDDLYGYAKSIEGKPDEARTFIATGARNYLVNWHPNMLSLHPTLAWAVFVLHYLVWIAVFGGLIGVYVRLRRREGG